MIRGIHHLAVSTARLDRLVDFYCRAFGFDVVRQSGWEKGTARVDGVLGLRDSSADVRLLRAGNVYLELFEFRSPAPGPADPNRPVCDPGYTHFCVEVDDVDAEYERLVGLGMRFHCPPPPTRPGGGIRAVYGRDPDGNVIELLEVLGDQGLPLLRQLGEGAMT